MISTSVARTHQRHQHPLARAGSRLFNSFVVRLAGTRWLPLYGVIEHRGRRSGRQFRTPVVVRPARDGLIVPMPWGETTDWYRNVRAAGECRIRWQGREYAVKQPEVLSVTTAADSFSPLQRKIMHAFGIRQCVRLHFA